MATVGEPTRSTPQLRARGPPSGSSLSTALAQSSDDDLSHRNRTTGCELTIELLKEKTGLTDDQLDQPIPEDSLFDIASHIPNWSDYAGSQGMELSAGEIQSVREDPSCTMTRMKAQRALELWRGRDPYKATHRRLLNMCLRRKDGDVAINIVNEVILAEGSPVVADDVPSVRGRKRTSGSLIRQKESQQITQVTVSPPDVKSENSIKEVESYGPPAIILKRTFPSLPLSGLSEPDMEKLKRRLFLDSSNLSCKFHMLCSDLFMSLHKRHIPKDVVVACMMGLDTFQPVFESPNQPLFREQKVPLFGAKDLAKIWEIISHYHSFFNYYLIEHISNVFGTDEDKQKMLSYKKRFAEYAERRVYECPAEFGSQNETDCHIIVKLDKTYDGCTLDQLDIFKEKLCDILQLSHYGVLRLCKVERGCYELTFQAPSFVQTAVFPLSAHQEAALKDLGVLWICCGEYEYSPQPDGDADDSSGDEDDHPDDASQGTNLLDRMDAIYNRPSKKSPGSFSDSGVGRSTAVHSETKSSMTEFTEVISLGNVDTELELNETQQLKDEQPPMKNPVTSRLNVAAYNGDLFLVKNCIEVFHCDPLKPNKHGQTTLHVATNGGQLEIVKYLVENRELNPAITSSSGKTPLHIAAFNGHLHLVQYFIGVHKVDPMCQDKQDNTPLHEACRNGNTEVVEYIISEAEKHQLLDTVISDTTKLGSTVLHFAASSGYCPLVQFLVSNFSLSPNMPGHIGATPLHVASHRGHLDIVQYLARLKGCDVSCCIRKHGQNALHLAADRGHLETVKFLTNVMKCDPTFRDMSGRTPLHLAALCGRLEIVQFFIDSKYVQPNCVDNQGKTPLHCASQKGFLAIVKYLVEHCTCDMLCLTKKRQTPLHFAASQGHIHIVKYFTSERSVDPLCANVSNISPLHLAVSADKLDVIKFYLDNLNCNLNMSDRLGENLLFRAVKCGSLLVVEEIVNRQRWTKHGFRQNQFLLFAIIKGHLPVLKFLILEKQWEFVTTTFHSEYWPLHYAAQYGHLDIIKFLILQLKHDPIIKDELGATALHEACYNGHVDVVEFLLDKCKVNNALLDSKLLTPLHYAVSAGHLNVVKILTTKFKCDINCTDKNGSPVLHYAAGNGHLEIMKFFISALSQDPNITDKDGSTPLHVACRCGYSEIVKYLLEEVKCTHSPLNTLGATPAYFATKYGHLKTLTLMIVGYSLDPMWKDNDGNTLLHHAAYFGQLEIVEYFISELSVTPNIPGCDGKTPLHFACEQGHISVVRYIVSECKGEMCSDKFGRLPLHSATVGGRLNVIKFLTLDLQTDPLCRDHEGKTPLHYAASFEHFDLINFFVNNLKVDPNIRAKNGNVPLHYAVISDLEFNSVSWNSNGNTTAHSKPSNRQIKTVKLLVNDIKCDVAVNCESGFTPLHFAAHFGYLEIVKLLIPRSQYRSRFLPDQNGLTPLHYACMAGHAQVVNVLSPKSECVSTLLDKDNQTPLHLSVLYGHLPVVKLLTQEKSHTPLCRDSADMTPLHYAVLKQHFEIVRFFVSELLVDPNLPGPNGRTPLQIGCDHGLNDIACYLIKSCKTKRISHTCKAGLVLALNSAIKNGNLEIVRCFTLLKHCDLFQKGVKYTDTPLHWAASCGQLEIVTFLLNKLKFNLNILESNGLTPLHHACQGGHENVAEYLLSFRRCKPHTLSSRRSTPLHGASMNGLLKIVKILTIRKHCDPNSKDAAGNTPLHLAAMCGHLGVVEFFIKELKCDPMFRGEEGWTPIHFAANYDHPDVFRFLLAVLRNSNVDVNIPEDRDGASPLHLACSHGSVNVVRYLAQEDLKFGSTTPPLDKDNETPLHYAARSGYLDIVKLLTLNKLYNPMSKESSDGDTPLHLAAFKGYSEVVKHFVQKLKCDPTVTNWLGLTPKHIWKIRNLTKFEFGVPGRALHKAAEEGINSIVKRLINEQKHDPNCPDKLNRTPLHYAAMNGERIAVCILLKADANPLAEDVFHNLPIHYAAALGYLEVVKILVGFGNPYTTRGVLNMTPVEMATAGKHLRVVNFLRSQPDMNTVRSTISSMAVL